MTMQEQLQQRLQALQTEFELGQKKLAGLEDEAQQLRHVLLRISGGIQVLQEELGKQGTDSP
jgi:hypothetical protein